MACDYGDDGDDYGYDGDMYSYFFSSLEKDHELREDLIYVCLYNRYTHRAEIRKIAESRADICKECPELIPSGFFTIVEQMMPDGKSQKLQRRFNPSVDDEDKKERSYKCGKCGCGFPANVFAEGKKCPLGKW